VVFQVTEEIALPNYEGNRRKVDTCCRIVIVLYLDISICY